MASEPLDFDEMTPRPPAWFWTLAEGRAVYELASFYALRPLLRRMTKGDNHPVVTLPGFLASDRSTRPLRGLLRDIGYRPYAWGLGRNMHFNEAREAALLAMVDRVYENHDEKVSLIGWSLGGVFAREIAKRRPDRVRCVISLGSPIRAPRDHTNARHVYDRMNGAPEAEELARIAQLNAPPPLPTTSIYSRSDGVVAWQGSIQEPHPDHPHTENIEVPASHLGIGVNPFAMVAIADRLSQPDDDWRPFDRDGFRKLFFRAPFMK